MKVYVAQLTTEHYTFVSAGASEEAAKEDVIGGFTTHLEKAGGSPMTWFEAVDNGHYLIDESFSGPDGPDFAAAVEDWYGIQVVGLESGQCARDWEVLS